jgi:6-phospho-3-hexuloisomerase
MTTLDRLDRILVELRGNFAAMPEGTVDRLATAVLEANRIALYGVGRTGMAVQGFAMRLAHLGRDAHFVGQLAAPPVGQGDLFIAALALGRLPTGDALLATARAAGAMTAVVTTAPEKVEGADLVLHLPGRTMADPPSPDLPLGSGFELALSLYFDLTVVELMGRLGMENADIAKRHANLL